jgi:hypothetical protein
VQFAAARPTKGGVTLGLATDLAVDSRLQPRGSQSWSERLGVRLILNAPTDVDDTVKGLIRASWEGA